MPTSAGLAKNLQPDKPLAQAADGIRETLKSMALAGRLQQSAVFACPPISSIGFESLRFVRLALYSACRFLLAFP